MLNLKDSIAHLLDFGASKANVQAELEKAQNEPCIVELAGRKFYKGNIRPFVDPQPDKLDLTTLDGLVDFLKAKIDAAEGFFPHANLFMQVCDADHVRLVSALHGDHMQRSVLIESRPLLPEFSFGRWHDYQSFIIGVQSAFVQTEIRDAFLAAIATIKRDEGAEMRDTGVSQEVKVQRGVHLGAMVALPNPLVLRPFSTFPEIEQPERTLVCRINDSMHMTLIEADGGAWRPKAIAGIKSYLAEALAKADIKVPVIG